MKKLDPKDYPNCNVEAQYKNYLYAVKLPEENMSKDQRIETRRAFYGAYGTLLQLMRNVISEYDDEMGAAILERMFEQVDSFFRGEVDADGLHTETRVLLQTLQRQSTNKSIVQICTRVLNKKTTIEEELKLTGSFMTAILKGDARAAYLHADYENKQILQRLGIGREEDQ